MDKDIESVTQGRTITLYVTNQEWRWLREVLIRQGKLGTDKEVLAFAKEWAKKGVQLPIQDKLRAEYADALKKLNWDK